VAGDVRQIGIAFFAGLIGFLAGAGLLALAFFLGRPAGDAARTLDNVLALAALLLASGGGFLALCAGPVLLAGLLTSPRAAKAEGRKQ
jgi:putative intracellular protease/amidase